MLRLTEHAKVVLFDDAGFSANGALYLPPEGAYVYVAGESEITRPGEASRIAVVSAVPKGDRADWMVEKLSELGVAEWIPLAAERSVVLPEGSGKRDRWTRIATESAKQSQRVGVMKIGSLTKLPAAIDACSSGAEREAVGWCLATEAVESTSLWELAGQASPAVPVTMFVGPEGGWTPGELERFAANGISFARVTQTVLRVETAAVAAAAVVAAAYAGRA